MTPTAKNRAEFIEECKSGKLDGVVAAYRTFGSISITGLVDEELVKALPESLKFIAHNGESIAIFFSTAHFSKLRGSVGDVQKRP